MTPNEFLDELKDAAGARNDADLARTIGVSRAAVSNWRRGVSVMDDYLAGSTAERYGLDKIAAVAMVKAARETDRKKREFWIRFGHRAAGIATLALVALIHRDSGAELTPLALFATDPAIHYAHVLAAIAAAWLAWKLRSAPLHQPTRERTRGGLGTLTLAARRLDG